MLAPTRRAAVTLITLSFHRRRAGAAAPARGRGGGLRSIHLIQPHGAIIRGKAVRKLMALWAVSTFFS